MVATHRRGAVGELAGHELERYPASIISFAAFSEAHPEAPVLSRQTGFTRAYGSNPYAGYDDAESPPFLFVGDVDGRLPPKARVITIPAEEPVAYPFELLQREHVVNDEVDGDEVVVFWEAGTASALDSRQIAQGADVGAAAVYRREVASQTLTFEWDGESFVDSETGSRWTLAGKALDGPLAGKELAPVIHDNTLWFAWAAFKPETRIAGAE